MPLQNRVTPFGEIVAVPQRGTLMGNRGIIHDPASKTLLRRRWTTKAWIACFCEFRGKRRDMMARQSWTELFFLDEATAFAAGHRPCFYCRREDALRFCAAWQKGNGLREVRVPEIDAVLHAERLDDRRKRLHPLSVSIEELPDGAMVTAGDVVCLILDGRPLRWSFDGYMELCERIGEVRLLTPPSIVRTLAANYPVALHPTAEILHCS